MHQVKKACLSCKHFRLDDIHSGLCRVAKMTTAYPMQLKTDCCDLWRPCGQQYYIRLGWIKNKQAALEAETEKGP